MKNNIKNIIVIACFITIITGFMLINIIIPDDEVSYYERRRLAVVPLYSKEKLFNGKLFEEFDKYTLDQFVFRDVFRGFKAFSKYYILNQKDNNDIYLIDGNIYKMEYPLDENSIISAAEKLNYIYSKYLQGMNVFYAVIPDKNYFVAAQNGYLSMDYNRMKEIMNQNVNNMSYIDLFDSLNIEDYYHTDIHWSQDKIIDIADKILMKMGNDARASNNNYRKNELYPFYGSYYGQAALNVEPDTLVYLTNDMIENSIVYDYQYKTYSNVYMLDKFGEMDSYDVFLSGATPLISIENPESTTNKELIIFRDSFGSSIAPLLLEGYSKITMIDIRYITTDLLGDFIDFSQKQDVLFLYNTQILNNSSMLK